MVKKKKGKSYLFRYLEHKVEIPESMLMEVQMESLGGSTKKISITLIAETVTLIDHDYVADRDWR